MNKRVQITSNYLNSYEKMHETLKLNPVYTEAEWEYAAKTGDLTAYVKLLSDSNKIQDINKFKEEYSWELLNPKSRLIALNNEINPNTNIIKANRYIKDINGNYIVGNDGKYQTEEYEVSQHDYIKGLINEQAKQREQEIQLELEKEQKESLNGFAKFMNSANAFVGNIVSGAVTQFENIGRYAAGTIYATYRMLESKDSNKPLRWDDSFVEFLNATEGMEELIGPDLANDLAEFERKYSYIREVDGSYTNGGKIFAGIGTTIGQMLPTVFTPIPVNGKISGVLSQIYRTTGMYMGFTASDIVSTSQYFTQRGLSVPSGQILAASHIKSMFQVMVEYGLEGISSWLTKGKFSGTTFDKIFKGRSTGTGTGLGRLAYNVFEEGIEEVMQDLSDAHVDKIFEHWFNDNFGVLTEEGAPNEITFQGLADTFMIAALTSLVTSGGEILKQQRRVMGVKKDKEGNVVLDKKGLPKVEKLSKFQSWNYNISLEAFVNACNDIVAMGKQSNYGQGDSKEAKAYKKAFTQMYGAYRALASYYNEVGEERFAQAGKYLQSIQNYIDSGIFDKRYLTEEAKHITKELRDLHLKVDEDITKAMLKAQIADLKEVVKKDDNIKEKVKNEKLAKVIEDIIEGDENYKAVALVGHGTKVVANDEVAIVPEKLAEYGDGKSIFQNIVEEELVTKLIGKNFIEYKNFKTLFNNIKDAYSIVKGTRADDATIMRELLFGTNNAFFDYVLYGINNAYLTGTEDMHNFLMSLIEISEKYNKTNTHGVVYKATLDNIIKNMKASFFNYYSMFGINENLANLFTKEERLQLQRNLWSTNLIQRLTSTEFVKLKEHEQTAITNAINNASISEQSKKQLLQNLQSSIAARRQKVAEALTDIYRSRFTSLYNGVNYMLPIGIGARTFNYFLRANNLYIKDILNPNEKMIKQIEEDYGVYNENNKINFFNEFFLEFTNGAFSLNDADGKLSIIHNQESTNIEAAIAEHQKLGYKTPYEMRRMIYRKNDKSILAQFVNKSLDKDIQETLTIEDLILDKSNLSQDVYDAIEDLYPETGVTPENTLAYFNSYFEANHKDTCIVITSNGNFALGNTHELNKVFKDEATNVKKLIEYPYKKVDYKNARNYKGPSYTLKDFVKPAYLIGNMADTKVIICTNMNANGIYFQDENIIGISDRVLTKDSDIISKVFVHEYQHCIQFTEGMQLGFSSDLLSLTGLIKRDKNDKVTILSHEKEIRKMIKDVEEHVPILFNSKYDDLTSQINALELFIYYHTGETQANGQYYLQYYPVITRYTKEQLIIRMPWGTTYSFFDKHKESDVKVTDTLVIENGIAIIPYKQNFVLENTLKNNGTEITIDNINDGTDEVKYKIVISNDGKLYKLDNNTDLSNNIYDETIAIHMSSVPSIYVPIKISHETYNSLMKLLDDWYVKNYNFNLVLIGENDSRGALSFTAKNGVELLRNAAFDLQDASSNSIYNGMSDEDVKEININKERAEEIKSTKKPPKKLKKEKLLTSDPNYYNKRRVTQKAVKGTNYEKFGYAGKYIDARDKEETVNFINNASNKIDPKLWKKVIEGKLTSQVVMDYLRDSDYIDDVTFKLINDSYFQNPDIETFSELQRLIAHSNEYYALYAAMSYLGLDTQFERIASPEVEVKVMQQVLTNSEAKSIYNKVKNNYDTIRNGTISLNISKKYLRKLWMEYYDGTALSARHAAVKARKVAINMWKVTGEIQTESLNKTTGEDLKLEGKVGTSGIAGGISQIDTEQTEEDANRYLFYATDREKKVAQIMKNIGEKYWERRTKEGASPRMITSELTKQIEELTHLPNKEFAIEYERIVNNMSEEELNKMFNFATQIEISGTDIEDLTIEQLQELERIAIEEVKMRPRPSSAAMNNIRQYMRKIKKKLSPEMLSKLIEDNKDIFNDDFTLKNNVYLTTVFTKYGKTKEVYKEMSEIAPLEERIKELNDKVKKGEYSSKESIYFKERMEREWKELERAINKAKLKENYMPKEITSVTVEVHNQVIKIETNKEMPEVLNELLRREFDHMRNLAPSTTQYLTEEDSTHIKMHITQFLEYNANYLRSLSQTQVDEIVDYFLNSSPVLGEESNRRYIATELWLSTFLLKCARDNVYDWTLTDEQYKALEQKLETIVSESGATLVTWREAMKNLQPEKVIAKQFALSMDIDYAGMEEDISKIIDATKTGNIKTIQEAKRNFYNNAIKHYEGRRQTILDKLLQWERLAMLSGPGTWLRNQTSNLLITAGQPAVEQIGNFITKLLNKLAPKKFKRESSQYKIIGTKVTDDVKNFIDKEIKNSGLLDEIRDGLNKYNFEKAHIQDKELNLTDLIVSSVKSQIFQDTTFKHKWTNKMHELILKAMSDDKSINKRALSYFGKILVEDNVDISKGLTKNVLNHLAEAYVLAAREFMHKSNTINALEQKLKEKSETAHFMWKQLAPFAASSWNWFVEGLNYTPIGLIKGIRDYAKLEERIFETDLKREKGELIHSSKFEQYLATKNIGKGILGSVGLGIGILLALSGKARIDEEDDKYKLYVGNVGVDITKIFGTQSIMLGIAFTTEAMTSKNFYNALSATLDTMFEDTLYTTFYNLIRYNPSLLDIGLYLPENLLSMSIPNFFKSLSRVSSKYKIKYSKGLLGKVERLANSTIPFISYALPHYIDPYSGEKQVPYKMWFLTNLANNLLPFNIYPYNVSSIEKEAIAQGINKGMLSGEYKVNNKDVTLNTKQRQNVNTYYGKLNKNELTKLYNNQAKYSVYNKKTNEYEELIYSKMTSEQKQNVIKRIMENNADYAKIYILTSTNQYKYYCSEAEYKKLKKLGITKNIYLQNKKLDGFIAI
jgi:hypothetical protein